MDAKNLKSFLESAGDDYDVVMNIDYKYIPEPNGERNWLAYINKVNIDDVLKRVELIN